MVYFMLVLTSSFTPIARFMTFIAFIAFSVYSGDFMCALHFYTGSILAYLTLTSAHLISPSRSWKELKLWLPIAVAILALFFGSYPDDGTEGEAAWSRFLSRWGESTFPSDCIFPPSYLLRD